MTLLDASPVTSVTADERVRILSNLSRHKVDLLYGNVVGVAPPPDQRAFYIGLLADHTYTTASLAVLAADTDLNQAHVNLVGLAQTGVEYIA